MCRLTCLFFTVTIVNNSKLILQTKSFKLLSCHRVIMFSLTVLSKCNIVCVSLDERLQIDRTIINNAVCSRHCQYTVSLSISKCLAEFLIKSSVERSIDVVITDNTNVRCRIYECTLVENFVRIVISQSTELNLSRRYNCIIRSNRTGCFILCFGERSLKSNKRQLTTVRVLVICIFPTIVIDIRIVVRTCNPIVIILREFCKVSLERNSKNTILYIVYFTIELSNLRSSEFPTTTCVNISLVRKETECSIFKTRRCRINVILSNGTVHNGNCRTACYGMSVVGCDFNRFITRSTSLLVSKRRLTVE